MFGFLHHRGVLCTKSKDPRVDWSHVRVRESAQGELET
jgi:hypothetical protein